MTERLGGTGNSQVAKEAVPTRTGSSYFVCCSRMMPRPYTVCLPAACLPQFAPLLPSPSNPQTE